MKRKLLFAALVAAASAFSASAEVLTPYVEQFENAGVRPKGWLRGGASYSYQMGTFTIEKEGGHSGGYISVNQSGNTWSSYYKNYSYNDLLVTPAVTGDVSIWVRKNGSDPTLTFFNIADISNIPTSASDFKMLEGTESNIIKDMDVTEWTKVTVEGVPEGTYLGIRAHNLDLDEFTAASANVLYRPSLIASVTKKDMPSTTINADADNKVTFTFTVTIENNGDIDFPESEEGFKVELKNKTADNALFGSGNLTEAIPCGTTVSKDFEMTGTPVVAPNSTSNNYVVILTHEKTGSVEASLGYFTVVPYLPNPKFMFNATNSANQSNYTDVNITDVITIGAGEAGTSRTLCLWNYGTAPLEVTAVTLTDGFKADVEPFTLANDEKKEITIALDGEPGLKKGTITFTATGIDDFKYDLIGVVTAEGDYAQDFEGEGAPEGMIIGNSWSIKAAQAALKTLAGEKYIECTSTSYPDRFSTPLLSFKEGEQLHFMATKSDNTSSKLSVYTSPDRVNWTLAKTITASTTDDNESFNVDKPTGTGYGTYEFSIFSVDVPEGNCYVQFEAGGARIDNIHGGKQVEVAHDIYVVKQGIPDAASVNTRYIPNITLRNLLAKAETGYSVVLEINGEKVAETTDAADLECGVDQTYDLRFTPHTEGDYTGKFVFVSGDDRVDLYEFEFTVGPEKAEATYQVGDVKITTSDPIQTYYNAQSQIIYRADQLGMDKGVKITGFHFTGYNTSELTKNVKVWIQNTEDEAYDSANIVAAEKDDMTLVYDSQYTFPAVGNGTTKEYEPVFTVEFAAPFTYEGKSLRVMIEQTDLTEGADSHHVFLTVDNSAYDYWNDKFDNRVIENKKEYAEDLDDEASWSIYKAGFPVTYFNVAKDVVVAKGTVTDEFGAPIENVTVSYTSDDILYSDVTDAEGNYSMNIVNLALTYQFKAEAKSDDYDVYTADDVTFDAAEPEDVRDVTLKFSDRTATLSGTVLTTANGTAPTDKVEVTLTAGENSVTAETDTEGKYTLTVPEFTHTYAIEVKVGGATYHTTDEYTFASKAETKHFTVDWAPVAATGEVTDEFGNPIEDVTVSYTSGDVVFTTTTGEDGKYELEIDRLSLTYTFTAEAEGFDTETVADITVSGEDAVRDVTLKFSDRTATLSGTVLTANGDVPDAKTEVILTAGGKDYTAVADAEGKYTVTVPELTDTYAIDVKIGGESYASEDAYTFKSKDDNKDFVVEWSSIVTVEAAGAVKVTAGAGVIYVDAPAGMSVSVYAVNGTLTGTQLSYGETLTFGSLAPGVYVAAGVKVLVR